ncbi:GNAT family N-acetyltransferase [Algicola sagamiensis]|uniref:GNAT family N-acetyltransferase n=1 Tax=Algicola sagamiensis TaxID=163869 RepID=UPI0003620545|nr:GNAT family N-acetyltransferase [Algicola sagamiensis]
MTLEHSCNILEVTTYYLEQTQQPERQYLLPEGCSIHRLTSKDIQVAQFFFKAVGGIWLWDSRLHWDYQDWKEHLEQASVHIFVANKNGVPIGFFELNETEGIELKFFGLLPEYVGQGLGSWLLEEACEMAWSFNPERVWVHTCSEDHPFALQNYKQRGFQLYHQETETESSPLEEDSIWLTPKFTFSVFERFRSSD